MLVFFCYHCEPSKVVITLSVLSTASHNTETEGGGRGCLQETSSLISVGSPGIKMASRRGGDGSGVGGGRGGTRWVFLDR